MPGLLNDDALDRVISAWRRSLRADPLLSRWAMPDLRPLAVAFNNALTGDDDGELVQEANKLVRADLEPITVVLVTTRLAETFTDETGAGSGAVTRSLVSTLGQLCGLLMDTKVADVSADARRDFLTGLENRRAWDEAMAELSAGSEDFDVAMLDLDGLKKVNDEGGHIAGDDYIKAFSADLASALHDRGRCYRFAGDEFAAVVVGAADGVLSAMLLELASATSVAPFSFGVASTNSDGRDTAALVKLADARLYNMKREHKQAIVVTSEISQPPQH